MSLPLLVMVVWVWPLVHVTICALLESPEASNLASSHDPPPPICSVQCLHTSRLPRGSVVGTRGGKELDRVRRRPNCGWWNGFWRGSRQWENVETYMMPARPSPLCTVFRSSLSVRWAGDERGRSQTAERQRRVAVRRGEEWLHGFIASAINYCTRLPNLWFWVITVAINDPVIKILGTAFHFLFWYYTEWHTPFN